MSAKPMKEKKLISKPDPVIKALNKSSSENTNKEKPNCEPGAATKALKKTSAEDMKENELSREAGAVAKSEYNCTQLMETLKSIMSVVKCYTCQKPLHSARVCLNGHGVCQACKRRSNWMCPTCKAYVTDTKPVMLDKIIKLLPRTCKFSQKGCESLVLGNDNDHEMFCRYRQTECRLRFCGWKGMAYELLQHLERYHGKDVIRSASQALILMSFDTKRNRDGQAVIIVYNNIFWQYTYVRGGQLLQFYQYVPLEKPQEKFAVMVSFHTPETNYSSTTPVHTDTFESRTLLNDSETFRLPRKVAISLSQFHSGVHYSVELIKKPM